MLSDDHDSSSIEVRDRDESGELLTFFHLRNYTYPPSVVSRSNRLYIKYTAEAKKLALIYMEIVAGRSKFFSYSIRLLLKTEMSLKFE